MPEEFATFTVAEKGVGKRDYSKDVAAARERAGILLKYGESLITFSVVYTDQITHPSPYPYIQDRLAAGATGHLYSTSTGLVMPYTLPKGYIFTRVAAGWTCNQPMEMWVYWDSILVGGTVIAPAGEYKSFNDVIPFSSASLDPTGASSHTADIQVVNTGSAPMEGAINYTALVSAVGTPPLPTTKDCCCPFCHHIQTVPVGTTVIVCENCHQTYYVHDYSRIKQL